MRIHFSADDLCKITLAPVPNAVFETALSVRRLRGSPTAGNGSRPGLARWHREMSGSLAARAGLLMGLVLGEGFLPDFLLHPSGSSFADGLELTRQTPASQLAAELAELHRTEQAFGRPGGPLGGSPENARLLRELAEGTPGARERLVGDLHRYYGSSVAPLWPEIRANATADRALRAEMLLRGGVDALLTTLSPCWQWQPPTLHLPSRSSFDVELCGRGLMLIPSYFATAPVLMYRPHDSTVLTYPMHTADGRPDATGDVLAPLLGRTRAAVLASLRTPATTTMLAERTGISLAGASQHAAVLRNAGLISTDRTGTAVLHSLRPLGKALLDGAS
ncbi:ArsR/SmtB family transcription factor [Streptomyces sp. NPDC058424]|uniref:ArsR/SmtB family transcription factor n=1 Tax=Streptomyces sp. NPDC058424 TaxID=3346491 RepID=UPI00365455C6